MSPSVSVLVPVYNGMPYLRQCLESLCSQTLQDAEFICINDGSTDETFQVLEEFARQDTRFRIVSKQNSGYGASMNRGLDEARGIYVGILEADDWAEPHTFAALIDLAQNHGNPDIVKANHYRFLDDNASAMGDTQSDHQETFVDNYPQEACGMILCPAQEVPQHILLSIPAIWAAIYRRDFIEKAKLRFLETPGAAYQDTSFVYNAWLAAETAYLTHDAFIHYRFGNEGSSTVSSGQADALRSEWHAVETFAYQLSVHDWLAPYMTAKKFQSYEWNMRRIAQNTQLSFALAAAEEFRVAQQNGHIMRALYSDAQWRRLQEWIAEPYLSVLNARVINKRTNGSRAILLRLRRNLRRKAANLG